MSERRPIQAREASLAKRIASVLTRTGVSPNAISAASMVFAAIAAAAFIGVPGTDGPVRASLFLLAILGMQGRLLCNLFDGMVAVEGGKASVTGEIWNDLPDRVSDTLILVSAGYASEIPELGWFAAVGAVHVAYIRVLGTASGAQTHFLGPMAKQHRMALLTLTAAVAAGVALVDAGWVEWVLFAGFAVLLVGLTLTGVRRLRAVAADLRGRTP